MSNHILRQIRTALRRLNPGDVRRSEERRRTVGLMAASTESLAAMEDFLAPPIVSRRKRIELFEMIHRVGDPGAPARFDLEFVEEGLLTSPGSFSFSRHNPARTVSEVIEQRDDLSLALARRFPPFRKSVVSRTIQQIAKENALFSLATALPDVIPGILQIGWAVGEFASDTTVITVNQIRMAFLIAAASDRQVGYNEQKAQIASIIAGAFGWRALARQLAGKIPFGAGLVPKAAVAYAGTYAVGQSLERYYGIGYGFSRAERQLAYHEAFERGKTVVRSLLVSIRERRTG